MRHCVSALVALAAVSALAMSLVLWRAADPARWGAFGEGQLQQGYPAPRCPNCRSTEEDAPLVLVLTPVKNAARHVARYFANLRKLAYPHGRISIALLDSDSTDEAGEANSTAARWAAPQAAALVD